MPVIRNKPYTAAQQAQMKENSEQAKLMGARDAVQIASEITGVKAVRLSATNYRFGNHGSFSIILEPNGVRFNDFESGVIENKAGIANLLMHLTGLSFPDGMKWLRSRYGLSKINHSVPKIAPIVRSPKQIAKDEAEAHYKMSKRVQRVIETLQGAHSVRGGDLAHRYLKGRGLIDIPSHAWGNGDLRYCERTKMKNNRASIEAGSDVYETGPTALFAFRDMITDEPRAMQRQRLTVQGTKHPDFGNLSSLGPIGGCAFKIQPFDEAHPVLGVCESLIDALSVRQIGFKGELWGLAGSGTIGSLEPTQNLTGLIVFGDNDEAGIVSYT